MMTVNSQLAVRAVGAEMIFISIFAIYGSGKTIYGEN